MTLYSVYFTNPSNDSIIALEWVNHDMGIVTWRSRKPHTPLETFTKEELDSVGYLEVLDNPFFVVKKLEVFA